MLYLSVRSRSSTLGCVASIHGRITPGHILVCVYQRNIKKGHGNCRNSHGECMLTIQKRCSHKALDDTGMMAFQHVNEGIKRSESKIGGFYFHFMRKIKVNKTSRRRHMKFPKKRYDTK